MQILLCSCQNYCMWIRIFFHKRCFTLKCILLIVTVICWRRDRSQFQANIYIIGLIKLKTFFKFGLAHSGLWWEINSFTIIVVGRWDSFCILTFDKFEYIFSLPWILRLIYYQAFPHYRNFLGNEFRHRFRYLNISGN